MKEIYVGNLRADVTVDAIEALFVPFGAVHVVDLHTARTPKKPYAYAFVEMDDSAADRAIQTLDGTEFHGQTLKVESAEATVTAR